MNKRQRCSVGEERDRVHVGAGVRRETGRSGLAFGALMGLSGSGDSWGCLLSSPLGRGCLGRGELRARRENLHLRRVAQEEGRSSGA